MDLGTVLNAFVQPIVSRGMGGADQAFTLRLLREYAALRVHGGSKSAPESFASVAERWARIIMECCPTLSHERALWMLSFVVMVAFSDQLQHGWYDSLMPRRSELAVDDVTQMIVSFCRAGITEVAASSSETA